MFLQTRSVLAVSKGQFRASLNQELLDSSEGRASDATPVEIPEVQEGTGRLSY